jgi:hypothetical protein
MAPLADVVVLAPDQPLFAAAVELMQSQAGRGVVVAGGRFVAPHRSAAEGPADPTNAAISSLSGRGGVLETGRGTPDVSGPPVPTILA